MTELLLPPKPELIVPDPKWAPKYYTKPKTPWNRGDDIIDFAASTMEITAGQDDSIGQPLHFSEWQKFVIRSIMEEDEEGHLRYKVFCLGLPRKNGKSLIGGAIALETLFYADDGKQIFLAAKDREQAKLIHREMKRQINRSRVLSEVLDVYRDTIVNKKTDAILKAISSDHGSHQGANAYLTIADEVHAWGPNASEFWSALVEGSGNLSESLVLAISTAGKNKESKWGELQDTGIAVSEGLEDDPTFGFAWWGADDDEDIFDENVWMRSNPALAEGIVLKKNTQASLRMALSTGDLGSFKRYQLNQWTRTGTLENFISAFHWDNAKSEGMTIPKGAKITVGFDGSVSDDSTGFVAIDIETGLIEVLACWERDYLNPEWHVPRDEVLAAQKRIFEDYDVVRMWCDPAFFQTDVEMWGRQTRGRVQRIPQSNSRMIPMSTQFKMDVVSGELAHNGDTVLRKHILNTVEDLDGKVKKERRGSKNKIDLTICAILANGARNKVLKRGVSKAKAVDLG